MRAIQKAKPKGSKMKLKLTDFDYTYHGSTSLGNNIFGDHIYHNVTACNELIIDDQTKLLCVYRTGVYYEYNDIDYPSNCMALYDYDSSPVINMIDDLGELWFEEFSEDKQETLDEIKKLCPSLDSFEKVEKVYFALRDNVPSVDDFIETSEDLGDYNEDDEGNLTLKK